MPETIDPLEELARAVEWYGERPQTRQIDDWRIKSIASALREYSRFNAERGEYIFVRREPGVIGEIAVERARQIQVEGWTPEHDDGHSQGQLAQAGACYAFHPGAYWPGTNNRKDGYTPAQWPWHRSWWKPHGRRRDLIRAGALIVAEIERLDRIAAINPEVT